MSSEPCHRARDLVPWDLDALSPEALRAAYLDLAAFVGWLRDCDIDVPACWHVHGWLVRRLGAMRHWRDEVLDPEASAKSACDWWSALARVQRDWAEVHGHHGAHPPREQPWGTPVATPALEDTVSTAVARRRRAGGTRPPW